MKIARVKRQEIPEVKKLLTETWVDTYGSFLSTKTIWKVTTVWHDPKLLAEQAQNTDIYFGVAKDDSGKIVGLTTVGKLDNDTLMMYRLYVHPDYQKQGIGKSLMEAALQFFPNNKIMRLEVEKMNQKGQSFYRKHGFREIESKQEKVEDEVVDVIVMEKELFRQN